MARQAGGEGEGMIVEGATLRLANLAPWSTSHAPILEGMKFVRCQLQGPVVVAVLERNQIDHSHFHGDLESMLWEVPAGRSVIGALGLRDCSFTECDFIGVGFAGTAETIAQIRAGTASISGPAEAPPWWPWR